MPKWEVISVRALGIEKQVSGISFLASDLLSP